MLVMYNIYLQLEYFKDTRINKKKDLLRTNKNTSPPPTT